MVHSQPCAGLVVGQNLWRYSPISVLRLCLATYVLLGLLVGFAVVLQRKGAKGH
ncbi:MAG: hypothetical protein ACKVKF_01260 [Rhodobacterales bacterium]|nr:hypothetical protein [Puniceibacterium antarcticum]